MVRPFAFPPVYRIWGGKKREVELENGASVTRSEQWLVVSLNGQSIESQSQ